MTAATKLKPCPTCGSKPYVRVGRAGFTLAYCPRGHFTTWPTPCRSGAEAIMAWGRATANGRDE